MNHMTTLLIESASDDSYTDVSGKRLTLLLIPTTVRTRQGIFRSSLLTAMAIKVNPSMEVLNGLAPAKRDTKSADPPTINLWKGFELLIVKEGMSACKHLEVHM